MKVFLILVIILNIAISQAQDSISVTYIANDGFLFSSNGKKILIDALYNQSFGRYTPPSDEIKSKIINGRAPFGFIDLYLLTHNHGDHFSDSLVIEFLKNHNETYLVSSGEVGDQCRKEEKVKKQIRDFTMNIGASTDTTINGIQLKIFRLKHMGDSTGQIITNLAYIIHLGSFTVLQMGDITIEHDKTYLDALNFQKEKIDILFLPYFDLSEESNRFVRDIIKPRYIVAKHMPPADYEVESQKFLKAYPNATVFKYQMEEKVFRN
jgi:L-ascorbate metabolism protein UlaG (beta-lactamase superfamily)